MLFKELADMFSLSGRVVLITGAAQGLGWAMAQAVCAAGGHVVLNDINADAVRQRADELRASSLKCSVEPFDITDELAVAAGIQNILARDEHIDVLVNNAGVQLRKPFIEYETEEWRRIFATHVDGSIGVTQHVLRHMLSVGRGRIIVAGSTAATAVRGTLVPYAMAKGALISMVRALAAEYGPKGITFNAIAPGYMATEFTKGLAGDKAFAEYVTNRVPSARWGRPEDIGPAVVYLASRAGDYINGSVLTIDGGLLAAI
jgi:gluconate 5-dehydrogenase